MSKCGADNCDDPFIDGVRCSSCNKDLHFACSGITETGYRRLGDRRSAWRCLKCKQSGGGASSSNMSTPPPPQIIEEESSNSDILREIRQLSCKMDKLDTMSVEIGALRTDMTDMKSTMSSVSVTLRQFSEKMKAIEDRLTVVERSNTNISDLESKIADLEFQLDSKEQWSRMGNLEIKGVPEIKNENLYDVVYSIGKMIKYPVQKGQINFVTRVPTRNHDDTKPIIVGFINRYAKEDYVAAARQTIKNAPIRAIDLGYSGTSKIFVNDHLTTKNKMLLSKAKKMAQAQGFQYIWSNHCKIMIRRDATSPIIYIKTEKDLLKIK